MRARHLRFVRLLTVVALISAALLGGCSSETAPEVPEAGGTADPQLVEGRKVWSANCSRCHGAAGGGGAGVKLSDGRAEELHPQAATMIDVVTNGTGAMPAFGKSLSDAEIEAVVRYVREVL